MPINLLPWRENRQQKRKKQILQYSFIYILFVFFCLVFVRNIFFNQLESIKKQTRMADSKFVKGERDAIRRNKTLGLICFLSKLPLAMQDNLYVSRILVQEDLIALNVYTDAVSGLEKFVVKLKKNGGIKKISIEGAAMYGGAYSEGEKNKFLLTLYLDSSAELST